MVAVNSYKSLIMWYSLVLQNRSGVLFASSVNYLPIGSFVFSIFI
nr:MAG TPA: hypothetical protein [Bacteriophage sp.]